MKIFIASLFLFLLLVMAWIDGKTRKIPDRSIGALIIIGIVMFFVFPEIGLSERISGAFCISVPFLFINLLIPGSFGGGDIKLMAVCGAILGRRGIVDAFVIAVFISGVYVAWSLARKKMNRSSCFAFGPFLCFGISVTLCVFLYTHMSCHM